MRIHVGCGRRYLPGYVNTDIQHTPGAAQAPDLLCHMGAIPLPDGCADEILAIHVWEHLYRWECDAVAAEWLRLLKPGGRLVLELPDALKCARNLLDLARKGGKPLQQQAMWGLWGDDTLRDPHMIHRTGWWPESLAAYLSARGFGRITHPPTEWHPAGRKHRDMRIEARKQ